MLKKKLFDVALVNRYYRMEDTELASEARKWKIRSYGNSNATIERQVIIDALLKKDNANNSRYALVISLFAIIISIVSLFSISMPCNKNVAGQESVGEKYMIEI